MSRLIETMIFQAKNVDFVDDFLNSVDEFQKTGTAPWRYEGGLSFKPICTSLAFVLTEKKKSALGSEVEPPWANYN